MNHVSHPEAHTGASLRLHEIDIDDFIFDEIILSHIFLFVNLKRKCNLFFPYFIA